MLKGLHSIAIIGRRRDTLSTHSGQPLQGGRRVPGDSVNQNVSRVDEVALAASPRSDIFATVREGRGNEQAKVAIWSLPDCERVGHFGVNWQHGGRRLALTDTAPKAVVAASYHVHGVSAYELNGVRRWQRSDIKKAQCVTPFIDTHGFECVAIGADAGPLLVLDATTGRTRSKVSGSRRLLASNASGAIHRTAAGIRLERGEAGTQHRDLQLPSKAWSAALSPRSVAIIQLGGELNCYGFDLKSLWSFNLSQVSARPIDVAWSELHQFWIAFARGLADTLDLLLHIDETGRLIQEHRIAPSLCHQLSAAGDILATDDGRLIDPINGTTISRYSP